jgi:hypothetical protein
MSKSLYEKITTIYSDLTDADFMPGRGTIHLQNDSDGRGDYIKTWTHPTQARPTQEQLDAVQ